MHPRNYGDVPPPKPRRKPGRKPGPDGKTRQIALRIPELILSDLERIAALRGETRAAVVVEALRSWLSE